MSYWLFKTEPDDISLQDIEKAGSKGLRWEGIRNYQARNFLRDQFAVGDEVLVYHSRCKAVGVVGTAQVVASAYPDPAQLDRSSRYFDAKATLDAPRWFCVDIRFATRFTQPLLLSTIKADPQLNDMVLVKQGRLSVQPVKPEEWQYIMQRYSKG